MDFHLEALSSASQKNKVQYKVIIIFSFVHWMQTFLSSTSSISKVELKFLKEALCNHPILMSLSKLYQSSEIVRPESLFDKMLDFLLCLFRLTSRRRRTVAAFSWLLHPKAAISSSIRRLCSGRNFTPRACSPLDTNTFELYGMTSGFFSFLRFFSPHQIVASKETYVRTYLLIAKVIP